MPKSLVIVTGASRGIGRSIARAVAKSVNNSHRGNAESKAVAALCTPLRMVLIARSAESLRETAQLVEEQCGGEVAASCHEMDLSDLDSLQEKLTEILEPLSGEQYDSCWLINNAGSLGPLGLASSIGGESDFKELRKAVDFNVTSSIWVASQFTKTFLKQSEKSPFIRIVNISSLCAIDPFPTMSIYCAGKAGRDMFHSVLAKEATENSANAMKKNEKANKGNDENNKQTPNFKVLNYAPGACATLMTDHLAGCAALDDGLRTYFATSQQENKLISPDDTAEKLVSLLISDDFESGSHVDYWDV